MKREKEKEKRERERGWSSRRSPEEARGMRFVLGLVSRRSLEEPSKTRSKRAAIKMTESDPDAADATEALLPLPRSLPATHIRTPYIPRDRRRPTTTASASRRRFLWRRHAVDRGSVVDARIVRGLAHTPSVTCRRHMRVMPRHVCVTVCARALLLLSLYE